MDSISLEEIQNLSQRLADKFGTTPPIFFTLLPPEVMRDTILNLSRVLDAELATLGKKERFLIAIAMAYTCGNHLLLQWLIEASNPVASTAEEIAAAKAVAVTCSTYNGYFKARSFLPSDLFTSFQPALRASPFLQSVLDKTLVELICIGVSIYNNCSHCTQGHIRTVQETGTSNKVLDEVIRTAAVISGLPLNSP